MARLLIPLAGAALMLSGSAQAADKGPAAELARAIEGRVAGAPVDCLDLSNIRSSRIIDRTAIIYETNNGTLYVNRPPSGANFLHSDQILITDTHTPQLCSIDVVHLRDQASRTNGPSVGLGKFVPYTKPKHPAR